jgi:hypothetical protein
MVPAAVINLFARIQTVYRKIQNVTEMARKVKSTLGKAAASAKMVDEFFADDSSEFTQTVAHTSSDKAVNVYVFSLLWAHLTREHGQRREINLLSVSQMMADGLGDAMTIVARMSEYATGVQSPSDQYQILLRAGANAYLATKAPAWDAELSAFLSPDMPHPIISTYIKSYHSEVTSDITWIGKMAELCPEDSTETLRKLWNDINVLATNEEYIQSVQEICRASKPTWMNYLPTAMFFASTGGNNDQLMPSLTQKRGQISFITPSLAYSNPSGYYATVREKRARAIIPAMLTESDFRRQVQSEQAATTSKSKFPDADI